MLKFNGHCHGFKLLIILQQRHNLQEIVLTAVMPEVCAAACRVARSTRTGSTPDPYSQSHAAFEQRDHVVVQSVLARFGDKEKLLQQSRVLKAAFVVTADDSLPDDLVTTVQVRLAPAVHAITCSMSHHHAGMQ